MLLYQRTGTKPEMSDRILQRKLDTVRASGAEVLSTSNPGGAAWSCEEVV
jgi:hypothetical protein